MTTIFDRIQQLADYKGYKSIRNFALEGLSWEASERINRLKKDNNKPSIGVIVDILNKFDDISAEWLLMGRGSMLKKVSEVSIHNSTTGNVNSNNISMGDNNIFIDEQKDVENLKRELSQCQINNEYLKKHIEALERTIALQEKIITSFEDAKNL